MNRTGSLARKTGETDIFVSLDLDGEGRLPDRIRASASSTTCSRPWPSTA